MRTSHTNVYIECHLFFTCARGHVLRDSQCDSQVKLLFWNWRCRVLLFAQGRRRLVNEHPREGNNQQCCLRSRHNKNKTEIRTRRTAISRRIFLEHLDWTTQLLLWSWSPSQPWVYPSTSFGHISQSCSVDRATSP